jgi:hypothetical protein
MARSVGEHQEKSEIHAIYENTVISAPCEESAN